MQPNVVTTHKWVQSPRSQAHFIQINPQRLTCPETHQDRGTSSNIDQAFQAARRRLSLGSAGRSAAHPESHHTTMMRTSSLGNPRSRQGGPATAKLSRWSFPSGDRSSVTSLGLTQGRLEVRSRTALHTTVPVAASGAFNPLHGVLCILRSLYFCSIGPRSVCLLATDTRRSSNCSPKPLYSRMQPATPRRIPVHSQAYGTVSLFCGTIPGLFLALRSPRRSQPLQSPQCLLESNESRSRQSPLECCLESGVPFSGRAMGLPVHSPLLQQSRLLAVPPLSDMLKFGGSFHVRQVTGPKPWKA